MADLSKIVCLEQDCRHGTEQTGSSGSGNDTYTKAEIDSKDADIRAAASEAKSAANNAQSVNQTQDGQIKALQEAVDNLHNYEHPAYSTHQLGFYKFANDAIGSVSDAQPVTKKDITDLGIPETDTNTTYELKQHESLYSSWCTDPTVILKGSDGNVSELIVPNTYATFQFSPIYAINRGASINNDKYKTILDLDYFAPNTYNPHFVYRAPIAIDIHVWLRLSGESTRNFRIKIYTSTAGDLRLPDMAFIRYAGDYSDVKDIKWTVGIGYHYVASGETAGVASVIRIGVDNDTYNKLANVNGNASMQYVTSANGVGLNIARSLTEVNDIPVDIIIRPFIDISRDEVSSVALSGDYNDLSNKPTIPDISGKQDKSTAVTHTANTAVGSATKPVYIAANGVATAITHSINADVPANAKFTDTTYSDATQSAHGLMTAADKKKLDGIAAGATNVAVDSTLSTTSTNPVQNKVVQAALNGKAASGHTHAMITNSMLLIAGANNAASWVRLGTLVSGGDARSAIIRVWSGNGYNAGAYQNASFEIQIKDGYQSTHSAAKACGVTVYRINCSSVRVKVIPTAHDTYTVWVYLPWKYWNGNYAVYGRYTSWTYDGSNQTAEPEGTAADTAYYDQAFLTSTVAKSTEATALTETAWTDVPATGAPETVYNSLQYLKSGNMVFVQGAIGFKAGLNTPICGTMPSGCLPRIEHCFTGWDYASGVPVAYPIKLGTNGVITLLNPTSTAYWFKSGRLYHFNFCYHIG